MIFAGTPNAPLLGVNIDHVATLRNARGGRFPDPVTAAQLAVEAGADIITFHLREDRRHIRDDDVARLKAAVQVPLNFEAAVTEEMLGLIEQVRPEHVCLVPERRQEVTTEGGLDVAGQFDRVKDACARLAAAGCRVSLFIGADPVQIEASARAGAPCIELHTGAYANAWWDQDSALMASELQRLQDGLRLGRAAGLQTNAGHGLAVWDHPAPHPFASSTAAVAALPEVAELHIGHALIGHALFVGLRQAIADFKAEAVRARNPRR
ncbi:pyridoxine 5'-phosphate synthase [Aquabacterium sp. A7-Y]|uniref:pyridoxine 5'-phosphate synthase n=1 Tax=Aquabacterium sp. A7-Y TaxID=1349605 RepID=UPI00223DDED9|nr:pyridoxine 5'-phosphate synthase [Aquabacterium sp. A7-Y]MCW7541813.1 pyridoxine 5'-phosphate synthase [Aquabacterium sp. A7-Y]